jgi:hypothetical protein
MKYTKDVFLEVSKRLNVPLGHVEECFTSITNYFTFLRHHTDATTIKMPSLGYAYVKYAYLKKRVEFKRNFSGDSKKCYEGKMSKISDWANLKFSEKFTRVLHLGIRTSRENIFKKLKMTAEECEAHQNRISGK